jgi:hypothetical protein
MAMIVEAGKLKEAVEQCLQELNDACYQMRQEGLVVLLPEYVEFQVNMVTNGDINAVPRGVTEAVNDGTEVTLREQLESDVESADKSGESFLTTRTPTSGAEQTTITHPSQTTQASGGDDAEETVDYTYEEA